MWAETPSRAWAKYMAQGNHNSREISGSKDRLAGCFDRGMHLTKFEKNYDYAHAMFTECVLKEPGNLKFVEAMIQNLRSKTPLVKKSAFHLRRGGSRELKRAQQHKDWNAVFRTGIELLLANPWDVATLQTMAEACAALHHNEVELAYLKQALDADPKSIEVIRHCAQSLGRVGQYDQAIACWHRIETLKGKNEEAAKMISRLAEERLKYPGGRPPTAQGKKTPVAEAEPEQDSEVVVVLTPRQQLEQSIAQDPHNLENYVELAQLFLESNQWSAAESVLSRAIAACGEQSGLVKQLERVRRLQADEERTLAEQRAIRQEVENRPLRIPWVELILALAFVLFLAQTVPSVRAIAIGLIDVPNWSRTGWFLFNIFIVLGLVAVRFRTEIGDYIRRRRIRRSTRASNSSR